jgi:hypothetical protein
MSSARTLASLAISFAFVGVAVLSACANTISAGSDAPSPTPQGPTFTGADAAPTPEPEGGLCNAYECPAPYTTCPNTSGLCTTNLSNDPQHCGDCDTVCPNNLNIVRHLHATFTCAASRCHISCVGGFADCNKLVDDGCEISTDSDPENCGSCGAKCAAGDICWKGACGCPPGYTRCGDECVKLDNDTFNCGACGNTCDPSTAPDNAATWPCGKDVFPPNTAFDCRSSSCGVVCAPNTADCNSNVCGDGCETDTSSDPQHCGSCSTVCSPEQICVNGSCICDPDKTRCGTDCVDLQNDALNCGACNNACPGATTEGRGSPLCVLGRCTYHCPPGFADCDHRIENGCEVDLNTDPLNCGACGTQCDVKGGQPCGAGHCLTKPCDGGGVF